MNKEIQLLIPIKWCNKCKKTKNIEDFGNSKSTKDGKDYYCKECKKEYKQKWRAKVKHTDKYKKKCKQYNKKQYFNITSEEYDSYFTDESCCGMCGTTDKNILVLDHDHKTGKIRGVLCSSCNTALGFLKDDIKILSKGIEWLKNK